MDLYDQEIEKLIKLDFSLLYGCWAGSSRAKQSGNGYKLFASCGDTYGCGCPTQIKGCGYSAQTVQLAEAIKDLEGIPKDFNSLELDWKAGGPEERRLLLKDFAVAQRMSDAVS
jgi:hypothetical protein